MDSPQIVPVKVLHQTTVCRKKRASHRREDPGELKVWCTIIPEPTRSMMLMARFAWETKATEWCTIISRRAPSVPCSLTCRHL